MVALALMVMLPEEPSWKHLHAPTHHHTASTMHGFPGVIVAVVYSLTPCHCSSPLLDYCCLSTHTHLHTHISISSVLMNELWTVTEVDVACYRGNSRCARSARMKRHTLTPGAEFISLHPLSCLPQGHMPHLPTMHSCHPDQGQLAMPDVNNNLSFSSRLSFLCFSLYCIFFLLMGSVLEGISACQSLNQ